ncbi:MAG: sigma-54-dependent Fis family transcriptional regulator [Desulfobacterales bacterium]|nr:MAG: sigma-54-dependent Fis family transcriptional regulator [Desulfobacterales bacterium]
MQNAGLDKNTPTKSDQSQMPAAQVNERCGFHNIIGQSSKMREVFDLVQKVADCDSTILLNGETGTGKGMVAKAIHERSKRRDKPFISINCGAIPENLLESELFGHVRGAFTGATSSKQGKFELADGGTILLDEIGDMSSDLQVKVLKVLEEGEFEQVGGAKTIKVDVRIIAATHRDLSEEVQKGNFREDLYYRLYVIPMMLPALRDRKSDIPYLISYFLEQSNQKNDRHVKEISDEALTMMMSYSWPGNVRELKNMVERLVVLKGTGKISARDLPLELKGTHKFEPSTTIEISDEGICLNSAVTEFEKALILQSLEKTKWVKNKAAKLLHLNRTTLVEKIKRHHLQPCNI